MQSIGYSTVREKKREVMLCSMIEKHFVATTGNFLGNTSMQVTFFIYIISG